jgi:small subunit ribosomal protein S1
MELDNPNPTPAVHPTADESAVTSPSEAEVTEVMETSPVASAETEVAAISTPTEAVSTAVDEAPSMAFDGDEIAASESHDHEDDGDEPEEDSASATPGVKRGELLTAIVLQKNENEVLVDLGNSITGVIPNRELQYLEETPNQDLAIGASLSVYVLKARGGTGGMPLLSISRALEEQDWRTAEGYSDTKSVFEGRIAGYNKGGLIVRFGRLRGFIPASQISQEREQRAKGESPDQRWSEMLNEPIWMKVVEVNRQRNRLILSERAASREIRETQKQKLIADLQVGDVRTGRVISLTDFGAFVDLGGADGLVHLTEISWQHPNHPREALTVGDEVKVKVINIDPSRKRIGLSIKALEEDPWANSIKGYQENQLVQGKITKLTRFGAFANLMDNPDVEGLIHVSELADYRVEHPRDVVAVGDVLTLRVIKIDAERRRLGLSLKRVNSSRYMSSDWSSWNP